MCLAKTPSAALCPLAIADVRSHPPGMLLLFRLTLWAVRASRNCPPGHRRQPVGDLVRTLERLGIRSEPTTGTVSIRNSSAFGADPATDYRAASCVPSRVLSRWTDGPRLMESTNCAGMAPWGNSGTAMNTSRTWTALRAAEADRELKWCKRSGRNGACPE